MIRKTGWQRVGSKLIATAVSAAMGLTSFSAALPGGMAYAETGDDATAVTSGEASTQIPEDSGSDASSEMTTFIVGEEDAASTAGGAGEGEGTDNSSESSSSDAAGEGAGNASSDEGSTESSGEAGASASDSASNSASEDASDEASKESSDAASKKASDEASKEKSGDKEDEEKSSLEKGSASSDRNFDYDKTDIWDFGAESLGDSYNNRLDAATINGFYDVEPGTKGALLPSFSIDGGDLIFEGGSDAPFHRIRSTNANLTRWDDKSLKDKDGNVYSGFLYSNKASTDAVYLAVQCQADDIITAYVASNGTDSQIHFVNADDASDDTVHVHTLGGGTASRMVVYPSQTGLYKFYSANEKLVVARVIREHASYSNITGTVDGFTGTGSFDLVFTNRQNGNQVRATVSDGNYSAQLAQGFDYDLSLEGADEYVIVSDKEVNISSDSDMDVTVSSVSVVEYSGKVTGIAEDDVKKFVEAAEFTFTPADEASVFKPVISLEASENGISYKVKLQDKMKYAVAVADKEDTATDKYAAVEDYNLLTDEIEVDGEKTDFEIKFEAKPVYKVTILPTGASLDDLAQATFTFTRLDTENAYEKDGYVYTFTGTKEIALRNGQYVVEVSNTGAFVQKLTTNLVVNGADVTKEIAFSSDITEWNFSDAAFTEKFSNVTEGIYNGLSWTNGRSHNGTYLYSGAGKITVPVKGDCRIMVTANYQYSYYFVSDDEPTVNAYTGTTNQSETFWYDYKGGAGSFDITVLGNSYITKIELVNQTEYKSVLRVGASDAADYKTIGEALEVVRHMDRKDGERVTISIEPGDYEEMLVVDTPNVTFENASATPTNSLKDAGVNIDENAVRITWYYGHGYTYYSMGSDYKYDADVLATNKANGYPSVENPGAGTATYWNASVVVDAKGFEAKNIIFENSFNQYMSKKAAEDVIVAQSSAKEGSVKRATMAAGDTTVQDKSYVERATALALTGAATECYFDGCKMVGRQDVVYGHTGTTAAFYNCAVYGGTDYIFGGMTAVFAKCDLVLNTSDNQNDQAFITAAQQKDATTRGYLMYNCTVKSTTPGVDTASTHASKPALFGRPWSAAGEAVFYNTVIDKTNWKYNESTKKYEYDENSVVSMITPAAWGDGLGSKSARSTEYGTYEISGINNSSLRASWSTQPDSAVCADGTPISVGAFLGEWDPFTANGKDMAIVFPDGTSQEEPESPETPAENNDAKTEFVLESSALDQVKKGDKKDGDSETAGTENYFTIIYSANSKVETCGAKSWEDDYSSTQRLSLGGKVSTAKNAVKFTTSAKATVKIWWVEGNTDNRQMTILDTTGKAVATAEGTFEKDKPYINTLTLEDAGTYYLGGDINNNYIFKIVVKEEKASEAVVSTLNASDIDIFAKGAKKDGDVEEAGTDKYFTIIYSSSSKVEDKTKEFEDGTSLTRRINLGGGAKTTKNSIKFTTKDQATVKVWWAAGDKDRQMAILDADGKEVEKTDVAAEKDKTFIWETKLDKAGTYYLGGAGVNNYIFKVEVTEGAAAEPETRLEWDLVEEPVVTGVKLNEENPGKIDVTVKAVIGKDGGDKLEAFMVDKDRNIIESKTSSAEKDEFVFTFEPKASGQYMFSADLTREDEDLPLVSEEKIFDFVLPLATPQFKNAVNKGNGKVTVKFYSVPEATAYKLVATDITDNASQEKATVTPEAPVDNNKTEYNYTFAKLNVGHTYKLSLIATRGEDSSKEAAMEVEVTEDGEREWVFSAFGSGVSTKSEECGYKANKDGSVTVWDLKNKGKIVPASTDGLSFYYTAIPANKNFTLTATATIDSWTFTNGQEGFGLMASDRVGVNGDATAFWNNSYMAIGSKVEYYYDTVNGEVTTDAGAAKITMKNGLGAQEKKGVTQENLDKLIAGDTETVTTQFSSKMYTLETSCGSNAGTYNILGNETSGTASTVENPLTVVRLRIQKNNTGFFVSYLDENDNVISQKKFYGTDNLSQIDTENIYVGFFASRTFKATFSNIDLTIIDPEDDAPAEDKPITYVIPNYQIISATYSNTAKYDLKYTGNADGKLTITDKDGKAIVEKKEVKAGDVETTKVTLTRGDNKFNVSFVPNEGFHPEGDIYQCLSSYDKAEFTHTVKFATINDDEKIYVSPDGKADADGSESSPVDIYTAVKYVQPGQTIVLASGNYSLNSTVKIERGIDGIPSKPIKMVTEGGRAVFDFNRRCAGFIFAGDYWYVNGIDCTKSGNSLKGIQVSGSHITLEDVRTYENGNTGIQVSRYLSSDTREDWPSYDLILNCTSYSNADAGYEDADGFAAKLTVGEGIVFDGCIAYNNADDGWDLFAKVETGSIGQVTIQNCVAFANGYGVDGTNEGNGNGFKMGGSSITGPHKLINSVAWNNKAKGIDSNSGPDIQVYNSMSFNNGSNNVALYTNDTANTDFFVNGVLSYRTNNTNTNENLKSKGTQDKNKIYGKLNFFWNDGTSSNAEGLKVSEDWFVSLDAPVASVSDPYAVAASIRSANGSIDLGNFFKLSDAGIKALAAAEIDYKNVVANLYGEYTAVTSERDINGSNEDAAKDKETEEDKPSETPSETPSVAPSESGTTSGETTTSTDTQATPEETNNEPATNQNPVVTAVQTLVGQVLGMTRDTTADVAPKAETSEKKTESKEKTKTESKSENKQQTESQTTEAEVAATESAEGSAQQDVAVAENSPAVENEATAETASQTDNKEQAVSDSNTTDIQEQSVPTNDKPKSSVPVAPIAGGAAAVVVVAGAAIAVKTGLFAKLLAFLHIIK
nr:pectinesterase family protein [uncultured Butyrivibrio sp.]